MAMAESVSNRRRSSRFTTKQEYPHDRSFSSSSDDEDKPCVGVDETPTRRSQRKRKARNTSLIQSFSTRVSELPSVSFKFSNTLSPNQKNSPPLENKENILIRSRLAANVSVVNKDKLKDDEDSGDIDYNIQAPPKRNKKGSTSCVVKTPVSNRRNGNGIANISKIQTTPLTRKTNTSDTPVNGSMKIASRNVSRKLNISNTSGSSKGEDSGKEKDCDHQVSECENEDETTDSGTDFSSESGEDDDEGDSDFETNTSGKRKQIKTDHGNERLVMIIKRQTALPASPGSHSFTSSFMETYNHESYLLANTRLKFKSSKITKEVAANDSRKGRARKPRKGTRGLGGHKNNDNLPERSKTNFSVTKETTRAAEVCLEVHSSKHDEEIRAHLESKIIPDFPRWMSFMWEGFNIILHGFGSKLPVVDAFGEYLQDNFSVIKINGLSPKLNPKKIIVDFVEMLELDVQIRRTYSDIISEDVCKQVPDHPPVFVIVQNFDTMALENMNLINVICSLVKIPWVHLLATTDSVNASFGLTQSQCVQLNFCWIPCSTFQPYVEEFMWTPNIFGESTSSKATENTLQYVMKSLTGNARKAFSILASLQLDKLQDLDKKKGSEFVGVEFAELARKCKDNFVAHNDSVLRTLLVEFVDHKLVTNHQGGKRKGANLLTIDLDIGVLERIVKVGM